tara:strand:+ start:1567 stop:2691 length:1125 start_codon:yes stop_codon:yes gene_type:complete
MSDLERAAEALGIQISDDPSTFDSTQTEEPQQEVQETVQDEPQEVVESAQEPVQEPAQEDTAIQSQEEVVDTEQDLEVSDQERQERAISMVSEMLGYEDLTFEQLSEIVNREPEETQATIDERLQPILDFVEETGRSPEDWFRYQQLNPSEMDDLSAVRLSIQSEYPDLTGQEVNRLMNRKYKLDSERFDEEEVADSTLELKIDAAKARKDISSLRDGYTLPVESAATQMEDESPFNENWYSSMEQETSSLEGIDFELPGGKSFNYGLRDDYRQQLVDKNSRLEEYFDQYVESNGSWNIDKLNMHRTVVDNIDEIVKNVYQQGMSDGQRKVVSNASNVQAQSPSNTPQEGGQDAQMERLLRELGGGNNVMNIKR